ncbi:hypothetical protein BV898_13847 [Hypsibius exemplaris]|uniref:Uncharacterized protein n=1 Tax=Hypsibius exemplaris TaxID=2072580 RepID=A0A1W0W9N1_HYPEX|nr:hypothetical protein BV898_13847 [Hypsibius exemplaris]
MTVGLMMSTSVLAIGMLRPAAAAAATRVYDDGIQEYNFDQFRATCTTVSAFLLHTVERALSKRLGLLIGIHSVLHPPRYGGIVPPRGVLFEEVRRRSRA